MKKHLCGILILITFNVFGQEYDFPKEINLVFDYMLKKDYPEVFNNQPYQFRPINWQIIDIDDDGVTEVFLQTFPHYRQSPTITIFQIDKNDSVSRITEGLAPGHLIKLSKKDDYFDPHTTGTAIDMQSNSNDPEKMRKLAESSLNWGMSVVLYKNFIHTDKREGKCIFLDLTHLNDFSNENSCANFQFSRPEQIIAGIIRNKDFKYFIARIDKELFCYKILGFDNQKFIKKQIEIIEIPKDLNQLIIDQGFIKYENKKGELIDLEI